MNNEYQYDVALSFAGEDRKYVEKVANKLLSEDISVFYDRYEIVELWGANLIERLQDVYRDKAQYCVIFISTYYEQKVWTTHELRSAQERAFQEFKPYILPARFDDTELPGLPSTTSYINLNEYSPEEFANLIIQKVTGNKEQVIDKIKPQYRMPRGRPQNFNPYEENFRFITFVQEEFEKRGKELISVNASLSHFTREGISCFRIVHDGKVVYSLNIWIGGIVSDHSLNFFGTPGEIRSNQNATNAWGEMKWIKERNDVLLSFHDFSLFGGYSSGERQLSSLEFVDLVWLRIVEEIEKRM